MIRLIFEIEADEDKCSNCRFLYSDIVHKDHWYCGLFQNFLDKGEKEEMRRSARCREMEANDV